MWEILFLILVILYVIIAIKVDQWITISALGFPLDTPEMFLTKPRFYDIIRSVLFLGALVILFFVTEFPWYIGAVCLYIIWLGAGWIGRKKAFEDYRRNLRDMIKFAESEKEKKQYTEALKKTNSELMDMAENFIKYSRY